MDASKAAHSADYSVAKMDEMMVVQKVVMSVALMAENLAVWKVALMDVPWVG